MKTRIVHSCRSLLAMLAASLLASCSSPSASTIVEPTRAQAERGFRVVLDESLWGTPMPWRYCDQIGSLTTRAMSELLGVQPKLTSCYAIKDGQPLGRTATLAALQARHGPADRVVRAAGYQVHYYGWFGFGTKDGGKSFGYLNAPLVMYHNGIEQSARNYLKTTAR